MNQRIHLLSCAKCRRQLDVSRLEPGDEVQCVCDAVLIVGQPKIVMIRGTACGRCGGAIGSDDPDCRYCGSELSAVDREETTLCPVCAVRLPNDSKHCKGCGVELRGSSLPPLPKDGQCPRCKGRLRVHLLPEAELIECAGECGGLWCGRDTFEKLQATARHAAYTGQVVAPEHVMQRPSVAPDSSQPAYIACLTCDDLMQRRMFKYENRQSGVVLDVCRNHGLWFDRGELESSLAFVRSHLRTGTGIDAIDAPRRDVNVGTMSPAARRKAGFEAFKPERRRSIGFEIKAIIDSILSFSLFD